MLRKNWWMLVLRGIVAILFGISIISSPGIALAVLILFWGAFAFGDGIVAAIAGLRERRALLLLEGVVGIGAGIVTFAMPEITAIILLYIVAFRAIMTGILEIAASIQLRKQITGEIWLGLSGLVSVIFGGLLIASPGTGILSLLWVLAFYGMTFGVMMILLGLQARQLPDGEQPSLYTGGKMQKSLSE